MAATSDFKLFPLFALIWVGLPLWWVIPFWVTLYCYGLVFLTVWRQFKGYRPKPRRFIRFGLLPAGLLILIQYRTLLQYEPVMALVLLATAFTICGSRDPRDIRPVAMMMIFLAAGTTLFSQSILIVLHTLLSFLWIGMILLETSKGGREFSEIFASGLQVLRYFLMALPVIVLIYFFFPRYEEALFSIYRFKGYGRTGISGEVYPGSVRKIIEDETVAFRAYTDGPIPIEMEDLYWRVLTLSYTDGTKWRESILDRSRSISEKKGLRTGRGVRQEILLDPLLKQYLVGLDLPYHIDALSDNTIKVMEAGAQTFRLTIEPRSRLTYSVTSDGHADFDLHAPPDKIYRWVPAALSQKVHALVSDWEKESRSDAEYLQKVLQYFGDHLAYTLEPGPYSAKDDFLNQLLFRQKKGFCEHFASAFAMLAREHGIPARLVVGYHGGTYNRHGRYWMVRQKNAHVWTEVFLENSGWIRIDPTAYIHPERIQSGGYDINTTPWFKRLPFFSKFQDLALRVDDLNTRRYQLLLSLNLSLQEKIFRNNLKLDLKRNQLIGIIVFGAALGTYLLFICVKAALLNWKGNDVNSEIVKIYKSVLKKIEKQNIIKDRFEGPQHFYDRIEAMDKQLASRFRQFFQEYIRLRYGNETITIERIKNLSRIEKGL